MLSVRRAAHSTLHHVVRSDKQTRANKSHICSLGSHWTQHSYIWGCHWKNLNDISDSSPARGSHQHRLAARGVTWMHVQQRGFSVWNKLLSCSRPQLRCTGGRLQGRFSWSRRFEASPKAKTLASAQISRAQPCFLTLCAQGHPHHVTVRPEETTRERWARASGCQVVSSSTQRKRTPLHFF